MEDSNDVKKRVLEYLRDLKKRPQMRMPNSTDFVREELPKDDGFFINRWANQYAEIAANKEKESKIKEEELKKKQEAHEYKRKLILDRNGYDIGEFEGE